MREQRGGPTVTFDPLCTLGGGVITDSTSGPDRTNAGFERVRAVADAVLYEGYLLYPYRADSAKNRVRWQFGVLAPKPWAMAHGASGTGGTSSTGSTGGVEVAGAVESWFQQTECLVEAARTSTVHVRVRFLQVCERVVERRRADGGYTPVKAMAVGGRQYVSFDEATARESDVTVSVAELLDAPRTFRIDTPVGDQVAVAPLGDAGRLTRRHRRITASVTLHAEPADAPFSLYRLRVRTENTTESVGVDLPRDQALRHCLIATHTVLAIPGGSFVSLVDPPQWAAQAAAACRNVHTFPVLAGPEGVRDLVLSAPILLPDHPQVAPESPADLFDATEIDEILSLRTLTLADAEKNLARATDPRAAELVDRVDAMPPELLARLHGALRSLRPASRPPHAEPPGSTETPAAPAPSGAEVVMIGGVEVTSGSQVRLHPRQRGTDAHDMFLHGRTARVREVLRDVDGRWFLAVTVDDDPAAELHHWYGRLRHFTPDEVEPLAGRSSGATADQFR